MITVILTALIVLLIVGVIWQLSAGGDQWGPPNVNGGCVLAIFSLLSLLIVFAFIIGVSVGGD